ncbi:sigma-70 family RNA polymerase sigma factor [Leptobacterium flavescens]|uniref:RNA polymerase sigma factor n=1 Tax=Leptobacterium flavescens TaxID=472055 RepID=A0A6P0UL69_9FLAO|nr:sigma-70 family RNA polymerase sigma factor [Leptobacterium flavescens]NER12629.1 sigma-70 family RNA polymerase sigma factor [Leptobacterium flavescens]
MELEELVQRFQQKDIKAFEKLYDMYADNMKAVIYNIVRNEEDVEEILQDVFVKVWNNSDSYSPKKGRFYTWLINISRNAAIDKTRSKDFKKSGQNSDATFFVDIFESHDNLDSTVDAIGIKKFVNSLTERCKNLIELIYFKGYTQKEVSEEIQTPLGTIKTHLRKCISNLREIVLN